MCARTRRAPKAAQHDTAHGVCGAHKRDTRDYEGSNDELLYFMCLTSQSPHGASAAAPGTVLDLGTTLMVCPPEPGKPRTSSVGRFDQIVGCADHVTCVVE